MRTTQCGVSDYGSKTFYLYPSQYHGNGLLSGTVKPQVLTYWWKRGILITVHPWCYCISGLDVSKGFLEEGVCHISGKH